METTGYFDIFAFVALPYMAFFTFFLVTIWRYRQRTFSYSSLSSQFLENQRHFWGLVPFHYGILVVLGGHILGFFLPRQLLWFNHIPVRLYVLEATGLAFALMTMVGLTALIVRRIGNHKVRRVTGRTDHAVYALLLIQVVSGILLAVWLPWGSTWFAAVLTPYLWSLVRLSPDIAAVAAMPALAKIHVVNAFLLIGYFPFTRLVHILVTPNPYLWRRPQVVRWYRNPQGSA